MLKQILDERKDLQHLLFIKGFIITNSDLSSIKDAYPLYSNWNVEKFGSFNIWTHQLQHLFCKKKGTKTFFLIGHAYNPFNMMYKEEEILDSIAEAYDKEDNRSYFDKIDELTGLFITGYIEKDHIRFLLDCSGMQYGCYGIIGNEIFIASHMQLIGDICKLQMDPYVKKLISYKWYRFMTGNYLPGELTAFKEVKRIIPNTLVDIYRNIIKIKRFYPNKEINMCANETEYDEVIAQASQIMKNNVFLIAKKWNHPAISLTGGVDSNTTFAAANGIYDKYTTFSYVSMFRESVDAEAARKISNAFKVEHKIYQVPDTNKKVDDFSIYEAILSHNDGDLGPLKDNDTRKKIILMQSNVGDVEVKSWVAEIARAYAYKYYGQAKFPEVLTPRNYTSMYKLFFLNRSLVWQTDRYFKEYLKNTKLHENLFNYDESDFFVWEIIFGGRCGSNIGAIRLCNDITIPYNNRKLLDLLLRVNLKDRIAEKHLLDMKKTLNKDLYDMNIRIINLNETKFRMRLASIYFQVNSLLPF